MSRFEMDDFEPPEYPNGADLFETRARQAIYSKRGRAALRELREALMHLPRHELIEGAVCRLPEPDGKIEEAEPVIRDWTSPGQLAIDPSAVVVPADSVPAPWAGTSPARVLWQDPASEAPDAAGVCAVGAWAWWQKVKAGTDPAKAFEDLPRLDEDDGFVMFETAYLGQRHGLTFTLAWELASGNDETFEGMTPSARWQAFIAWIDRVLAMPPLRRGSIPREMKRLGQSWAAGS